MPDSRQSFAAETVVGASAASSALQSVASCASHAVGSLHFVPADFASPQKSCAAAGAALELQPPSKLAKLVRRTATDAMTTVTTVTCRTELAKLTQLLVARPTS